MPVHSQGARDLVNPTPGSDNFCGESARTTSARSGNRAIISIFMNKTRELARPDKENFKIK